jgi:hypothetical protein
MPSKSSPASDPVSSAEPILVRLEAEGASPGVVSHPRFFATRIRELLTSAVPFEPAVAAKIRYWVTEVEQLPSDSEKAIAKDLRAWADKIAPEPRAPIDEQPIALVEADEAGRLPEADRRRVE